MIEARILLKNSASACNKDLLGFLHSNIDILKKYVDIKTIIVYKDLYPKLGGHIKSMPAMIINGSLVTGNDAIKERLTTLVQASKDTGSKPAPPKHNPGTDLESFLNGEMFSGEQEGDAERESDPMKDVMNRAMQRTAQHREFTKKNKPQRKETIVSSSREDNIKLSQVEPESLKDMVSGETDLIQAYFANQEQSPGDLEDYDHNAEYRE